MNSNNRIPNFEYGSPKIKFRESQKNDTTDQFERLSVDLTSSDDYQHIPDPSKQKKSSKAPKDPIDSL